MTRSQIACFRRARWRLQQPETQRLEGFIQVLREYAVSIVNQIIVGVLEADHLAQRL
jgi:hypothetical protein